MSDKVAHCSNVNRPVVRLKSFDPAKNAIVADVAALFKNADIYALAHGGGCMSGLDEACQPVMRDLGVTFNGQPAGAQQLFSVR
jgi:hypothetical protein